MQERENFEKPQDYERAPHRLYDSPEQEAIIVTAECFRARRFFLQYDDTRLVKASGHTPAEYRFSYGKMSPEDATSKTFAYTNCAAFTYDVYREAFDLDILAWTTDRLIVADDMHVYKYVIRGDETPEEKAEVEKTYKSKLEPGDIVVMRYAGDRAGHAMLYVGDGKIIHSSAPGGGNFDYEEKIEKLEPNGSVQYLDLDALFDPENRRYFFKSYAYAIVRPSLKYKLSITEKTKNRVKYLQNIYCEKTANLTAGQTADLGETVEYTFHAVNYGDLETELAIEDTVSDVTEYVCGGKLCGGKVSLTLKVPAGGSAEVSYKVRVKNDKSLYGRFIDGGKATVCGVAHKCTDIYIAPAVCPCKIAKINAAADSKSDKRGEKLLCEILGKEIDAQGIMDGLFTEYKGAPEYQTLAGDTSILVPTMYGGRFVVSTDAFRGNRTRSPLLHHLTAGDVIFYGDREQTFCAVFTEKGVFDLEKAELLSEQDSQKFLYSLIAYYRFAIVRI